jgi:hypothetical protein
MYGSIDDDTSFLITKTQADQLHIKSLKYYFWKIISIMAAMVTTVVIGMTLILCQTARIHPMSKGIHFICYFFLSFFISFTKTLL